MGGGGTIVLQGLGGPGQSRLHIPDGAPPQANISPRTGPGVEEADGTALAEVRSSLRLRLREDREEKRPQLLLVTHLFIPID